MEFKPHDTKFCFKIGTQLLTLLISKCHIKLISLETTALYMAY